MRRYYKYPTFRTDDGGEGGHPKERVWLQKIPKGSKQPGLNYLYDKNLDKCFFKLGVSAMQEFFKKHEVIGQDIRTLYRGNNDSEQDFKGVLINFASYTAQIQSPLVPEADKNEARKKLHDCEEQLSNAYHFLYPKMAANECLQQTINFINSYVKNHKDIDPNAHERN